MIFQQIKVGQMENFSYVIGDSESKECAVVDPGWDIDKILDFCSKNNLKIKKIILTHTHYDHINDVDYLFRKTHAEVFVHSLESESIIKINNNIKIKEIDDGDKIKIGNIEVNIIHTPGHTPGSVCLLFDGKLITGDTLFVGSVGRIDLPGGNAEQIFESLQKLKKLDDNIEVYPGHDYGSKPFSTIGEEKKNNVYMKASGIREVF